MCTETTCAYEMNTDLNVMVMQISHHHLDNPADSMLVEDNGEIGHVS